MDDEPNVTESTCWTEPPKATPITDILGLKALAEKHGVPIDSPEAFPGTVELLDVEGNRSGIIVNLNSYDPMHGMRVRPEYPRE